MNNSILSSDPIHIPEPKEDNRKTGEFIVEVLFPHSYQNHNNKFGESIEQKALLKLAMRAVQSMKDGRQYCVKMARTGRSVTGRPGGPDGFVETHTLTIMLVHPADCQPGELCLSFEHNYPGMPPDSYYRPVGHIEGCLERIR